LVTAVLRGAFSRNNYKPLYLLPLEPGVITIKDKQFKPLISEKSIADMTAKMAEAINKELAGDFPVFLAVLNGSFMFASDLLRQIKIPCEISFIKVSSYQGTSSTGSVKQMLGLDCDVSERTVVILEDIVDSGLTLETLEQQLRSKGIKKLKVATFLFKPAAYKRNLKPDYVGFEVADHFVVGYGMDYDGQGRNLKEVHVVAS
jgi:hypoxanthine phosphoribosyltransferase